MSILRTAAWGLLILLPAAAAPGAGIPDLSQSEAWLKDPGAAGATIACVPDGRSGPLTEARLPGGLPVDATILLRVLDGFDVPVAGFPLEDLWLESADGGLAFCAGGTVADADTDATGLTSWSRPLRAGGWSEGPCRLLINGDAVLTEALDLDFNSPDLDGDLAITLMDVGVLARGLGASCP